jgi:hypothetical protein
VNTVKYVLKPSPIDLVLEQLIPCDDIKPSSFIFPVLKNGHFREEDKTSKECQSKTFGTPCCDFDNEIGY